MRPKLAILAILLIFASLAGGAFIFRVQIQDLVRTLRKEPLPEALPLSAFENFKATAIQNNDSQSLAIQEETSPQNSINPTNSINLINSINLDVPFTSQAPHGRWDLPWQELCEEAAVLMTHKYLVAGDIPNPDYADQRLHEIKAFEEESFGYYEHTTAEETAKILREFYGHKSAKVYYDITIEDIKNHLRAGRPVIAPTAGRLLGNPYFRQPGPIYHMLVIKGFKDGKFITNDNGTRRGKDYVYDQNILFNAIHDWHPEDITKGRKAIIVVE